MAEAASPARRLGAALPWALIVAAVLAAVWIWRGGLWDRLDDLDAFAEWLRGQGPLGPLVFVGLQVAQVVVFFIPGEITQFAAGYVFGTAFGFLLSALGIMIGSAFAYLVGRKAGRPLLARMMGREALARIDAASTSDRARAAVFLLFLIPGAPKDAMSYAAGVTGMGWLEFMLISGLGRAPAMLFSIMLGDQLQERDYGAFAATAAVAALSLGLFWLYRRRRRTS